MQRQAPAALRLDDAHHCGDARRCFELAKAFAIVARRCEQQLQVRPRQFRAGKGVNELTSSEVNPIHEVHYVGNMWAPSTGCKDCRCDVRKVTEAADG